MKVTPTSVKRIEHIIDASGAVNILANGLRTDKRGRKQNTTAIRLLLVGILLSIHHDGSGTVTDAYDTLTGLSIDDQLRLGVAIPDPSSPNGMSPGVTLAQLYYGRDVLGDGRDRRVVLGEGQEEARREADDRGTRQHRRRGADRSV